MLGKLVPILFFISIHFTFLLGIVFPFYGWWFLLGILPLLGYFSFKYTPPNVELKPYFMYQGCFALGVISVSFISDLIGGSAVVSSSIIGLLASFFTFKNYSLIPAALYAGSFTGMTSFSHFDESWIGFTSIIIGGNFFYFLKDNFNGLGGKLGSIGFGALLIPVLLNDPDLNYLPGNLDNCFGEVSLAGILIQLFIKLLVVILVAGAVYYLGNKKDTGFIRASSGVTLFVVLAFSFRDFQEYEALIFGASFVGMSSKKVLSWFGILTSSLIFTMLFFFLETYYQGFGGTLGTTACLSCLTGVLLQKAFQRQSIRV